jgi:hypothetical protein
MFAKSFEACFSLASAMTSTSFVLQFYEMLDPGAVTGGRIELKFTGVSRSYLFFHPIL